MNIIEAKNLKVNIGGKEILHGINLGILQNKITVILGPNGSGKSTTLKALCRLLPYSGSVTFAKKELIEINSNTFAKKVALLAQNPTAPSDLTVLDLVKLGRSPHHKFFGKNTEDTECIAWSLAETNMTLMQDRIIETLSGGERQRAWLAMALAQKPQVLFLDEPTSYLDICHQLEIMDLIRQLNKKLNLTIVMVLHDLTQAINIADEIFIIKNGNIAAFGNPAKIDKKLLDEIFQVQIEEFKCFNNQRAIVPVALK